MRLFILRTLLFAAPIVFLGLYTEFTLSSTTGDLSRVGKVNMEQTDIDPFEGLYPKEMCYEQLSETDLVKSDSFDFVVIGDSFSGRGIEGYQNFICEGNSLKVLNFDRNNFFVPDKNPLLQCHQLLNGDFFEKKSARFIVLQSVERFAVKRSLSIDKNSVLNTKTLEKRKKKRKNNQQNPTSSLGTDLIKYPVNKLLYLFDNHAFFSKVYRVPVKRRLSTNFNDLLFYHEDVDNLTLNNNEDLVENMHEQFNLLADKAMARGTKLIILIAPDKYDLFYNDIEERSMMQEPLFFTMLSRYSDSKYALVNSKKILRDLVEIGQKDVYLPDDTHWSVIGAERIGKEIVAVANNEAGIFSE